MIISEYYTLPNFTVPVLFMDNQEQFYFSDETQGMHGPYSTLQEAAFELGRYCMYYDSEPSL